uniref:Uncharacterized protein n=1 Tax=Rhizophora mucronata TaxID=61149 RepID=A0A2P2PYX9_RHIMU
MLYTPYGRKKKKKLPLHCGCGWEII